MGSGDNFFDWMGVAIVCWNSHSFFKKLQHFIKIIYPRKFSVSTGSIMNSNTQMNAILERERARTDRNNSEFSLVIFHVEGVNQENEFRSQLLDYLPRRVRSCDSIGWIGQSVGVILPETSKQGAYKFVGNVLEVVDHPSSDLACTVYTYPSDWLLNLEKSDAEATMVEDAQTNNTCDEVSSESEPVLTDVKKEAFHWFAPQRSPFWKRSFDLCVALASMFLLFPVFILSAVLIRVLSPGPIFFKQQRLGYRGQPFVCWKFRTMKVNAETSSHESYVGGLIKSEKPMIKLDASHDPRIIPFIGNIMRQTGIDELPQLLNVLRGEMSIIGPRPCLPTEAKQYLLWHTRRFDTVPGLTGLWQVSGKNRTTFKEMIRLDISYTKNKSLWLDSKIIFKTIPAIIDQIKQPKVN